MLTEKPFSALLRKDLQVSSCLVSRQTIGPARFPEDLTRGEDTFFWLTLACADCSFRINHAQLGFHRIHPNNSISHSNWWKASQEYYLKIFNTGMVTKLDDRLVVHLRFARLLMQFDYLECLKHILSACRILVSFKMIPSWPMLLKAIPAWLCNKWRYRKVNKVRKTIITGDKSGYRQ